MGWGEGRTVCAIFDFMERAGENMQFMIQARGRGELAGAG